MEELETKELRKVLEESLEICENVSELYDDMRAYQAQIIEAQEKPDKLRHKMSTKRKWMIALGILAVMFGMMMFVIPFMEGGMGVLAYVAIFVVIIAVLAKKNKKTKAELAEFEASAPETIRKADEEIKKIKNEMAEYMNEVRERNLYDVVPEDYFSVEAISFFITAFDRKLVTNMHEACVLYHRECKDREQREAMEYAMEMQAQQMDRLTSAVELNTFATLSSNRR